MPSNTVSRLAHHDQRINTTASKSSVLHCTEMAPATVPKLPLEILLMIADHLPGSTLSSLSRTCRALHHLLRQALDKYFSLNAPRIFRWAAICNLVAPVQRCLALGTPLPEFRRHTVLGILAQQGCNYVARILLLHGADPNAMDRWGLTPLYRAVTTRNLALARILLEHGAKVEVKNGRCYGSTVVEVARRAKDKEMEELLGTFGAVVQDSLRVGEAIEWWL